MATGEEGLEMVTRVEGEPVATGSLVATGAEVAADVPVAGADVSTALVELPAAPVSTAELEAEVMTPVGSPELVPLVTGTSVTVPVGVPVAVPVGALVMVAEPVTGGSLEVEFTTEPSEVEMGGSGREMEMGSPGVVEGGSDEVALDPSCEVAGLEVAADVVPVGSTGGRVSGRDKLGRRPPEELVWVWVWVWVGAPDDEVSVGRMGGRVRGRDKLGRRPPAELVCEAAAEVDDPVPGRDV